MKNRTLRDLVAGFLFFAIFGLIAELTFSHGDFDHTRLAPPDEYGGVLMKGSTAKAGETPVVFSHWVHRAKHTCGVCHGELDFTMRANETGVVCDNGS